MQHENALFTFTRLKILISKFHQSPYYYVFKLPTCFWPKMHQMGTTRKESSFNLLNYSTPRILADLSSFLPIIWFLSFSTNLNIGEILWLLNHLFPYKLISVWQILNEGTNSISVSEYFLEWENVILTLLSCHFHILPWFKSHDML